MRFARTGRGRGRRTGVGRRRRRRPRRRRLRRRPRATCPPPARARYRSRRSRPRPRVRQPPRRWRRAWRGRRASSRASGPLGNAATRSWNARVRDWTTRARGGGSGGWSSAASGSGGWSSAASGHPRRVVIRGETDRGDGEGARDGRNRTVSFRLSFLSYSGVEMRARPSYRNPRASPRLPRDVFGNSFFRLVFLVVSSRLAATRDQPRVVAAARRTRARKTRIDALRTRRRPCS